MKYSVHRLDVAMESAEETLERFLNELEGELVSIIPNYARTSLFQIYGLSRKIDFLLTVERLPGD